MDIKDFLNDDNYVEPSLNLVEVGYFSEIDYDKKELLKSVSSFISKNTYDNIFDLYNNYKIPPYEYSYVQCIARNKRTKLLIPITLTEDMDEDKIKVVSEEDFRKDWISHSQYGFSLCMSKGFKTIAKMIAAHHGRSDWGAIIDLEQKDLDSIIYLLHHIDDLSAKFGKISISQLN